MCVYMSLYVHLTFTLTFLPPRAHTHRYALLSYAPAPPIMYRVLHKARIARSIMSLALAGQLTVTVQATDVYVCVCMFLCVSCLSNTHTNPFLA